MLKHPGWQKTGAFIALSLIVFAASQWYFVASSAQSTVDSDAQIVEKLNAASDHLSHPLVMEVTPNLIDHLKQGSDPVGSPAYWEHLQQQSQLKRVEKNGVVVLRPTTYPPTTEFEAQYLNAASSVARLAESLNPTQKKAIVQGKWINVKYLDPRNRSYVKATLTDFPISDDAWNEDLTHSTVAFTFLFDPYIEITQKDHNGSKSTRMFLLTHQSFPALNQFHSDSIPGIIVSSNPNK